MTWLQRYRIRHYFANALWIWPLLSVAIAKVSVDLLQYVEIDLSWTTSTYTDTAQAVLGILGSSMFTFIVFVCSTLLLAVQLASSLLTPRIIGIVFKDPVTKVSLTIFVFSFTFTLAALVKITKNVPMLTAQVAAYSCLASLCVFIYLLDHVGKALRPSGALRSVANIGHAVIESVYPRMLDEHSTRITTSITTLKGEPTRVVRSRRDGVVLAFDTPGLVFLAQFADCVIELVPQVGDFVAAGDPLFRIYEGGGKLLDDALCASVAVGQERTPEQDPAFAFRIMVDIAAKGLSPAINDPTTAVLAIDQIHHLLRKVGERRLDDERVRDSAGRLRLAYRTPDWEDFVRLSVTEIRQFGGTSIQIARRLRAMLNNLIETLPPARAELLRHELELLQRSAARSFADPDDRAMADVSDSQGMGGKLEPTNLKGEVRE
jgi:uncharacterized membrane protein